MSGRPEIKVKTALGDKVLEGLGWLSLLTLVAFFAWNYRALPDKIPGHFTLQGLADRYGKKRYITGLPLIAALLFLLLGWLNKFPEVFNYPVKITAENARRQYGYATRAVRWLKLGVVLICWCILYNTVQSAKGHPAALIGSGVPVLLCLMTIGTVMYVAKAIRDSKQPA